MRVHVLLQLLQVSAIFVATVGIRDLNALQRILWVIIAQNEDISPEFVCQNHLNHQRLSWQPHETAVILPV